MSTALQKTSARRCEETVKGSGGATPVSRSNSPGSPARTRSACAAVMGTRMTLPSVPLVVGSTSPIAGSVRESRECNALSPGGGGCPLLFDWRGAREEAAVIRGRGLLPIRQDLVTIRLRVLQQRTTPVPTFPEINPLVSNRGSLATTAAQVAPCN